MTSTPWPKLAFAQRSDPGREPAKQVNEDAAHYQETPLGHLLVVCDGMGGHSSGREASNLAIATIVREVSSAPAANNPGEVLRNSIIGAGRQVFSLGGIDNNPSRPGSTCVALLIHSGGTEVAHIGDSRAYLLRKGQLWPLTRDHSMVQQMVDAGLLRPEEASAHPDSNKITRALGMRPDSDVELRIEPMIQEARDLFLLITDGVSDVVPDADLQAMAGVAAETGNVEPFCEQVIALSNARGGPDNCTVQAAFVLDPGLDQEKIRSRAPAPTQVDLEGPPGLALEAFDTPLPSVAAQPVAPALAIGPQRTMPLAAVSVPFGSPPAPPPEAPQAAARPTGTRRASATIPFALTPAAGMPAAGAPAVGAPAVGAVGPTQGIPPVNTGASPALPPPPAAALPPTTPPAPTRRWGWVVLGLALFVFGAALVAGVAWLLANEDEEPPALPEAPAASDSAAPAEPSPAAPPPATPVLPRTPPVVRPPRGGTSAQPSASSPPVAPPKVTAPATIVPTPPPPNTIVPAPPPSVPKTPPGPVVPAPPPTR